MTQIKEHKFSSQKNEQTPLDEEENNVSCDVDSLFPNIPVQEIIDYIICQIFIEKQLRQICNKIIFRTLLLGVPAKCSFQLKQKIYEETEGYSMADPVLVTLANNHII